MRQLVKNPPLNSYFTSRADIQRWIGVPDEPTAQDEAVYRSSRLLRTRFCSDALAYAGIQGIYWSGNIKSAEQEKWNARFDRAIENLVRLIPLHFHNRVWIEIKDPPFRPFVSGTYMNGHVELSSAVLDSPKALAHELGHAFHDLWNGWRGCFRIDPAVETIAASVRRALWRDDRLRREPEEVFAQVFESYLALRVGGWCDKWAEVVIPEPVLMPVIPILECMIQAASRQPDYDFWDIQPLAELKQNG